MRILDTDVCIEMLRGNLRVIQHRQAVLDDVVTTWITAAELFYGAAKSRAPTTNRELVGAFLATIRVVGFDQVAVERFGALKADLEQQGQRLADADLFIASIALAQRAILITGNLRHYQRIVGLRVEDWIRGQA